MPQPIDLEAAAPVAIMMVGLQGAGKTTTTAKIAKRLVDRQKRRVLMASLDVKRPAAQEQLAVLGRQVGVDTLPIVVGQTPVQIARRAEQTARLQGYDVVIFDTAGRTHIDEPLMAEMAEIKAAAKPHEILLVADSLTGQDAVNLAKSFDERVGVTGIVLTRIDGDGRGGAALSMRAVTGKPIKLIGTGEKMDALEDFHPARIANRILGMGDIVSLVEKAAESIDAEQALRMAEKMRKGRFDLEDLSNQLAQVEKLGGMGGIMGMLPGMGKIKEQMANANIDERMIKRQRAIISSMTREERRTPDVLKASRKKRIAAGAGMRVEDVNRLLKQHRQMADMMKALGGAKKGGLGKMAAAFGLGGGNPLAGMPEPTPAELEALQKQFGGGGGLPSAPPPVPSARVSPEGCPPACPASEAVACRDWAAASTLSEGRRNEQRAAGQDVRGLQCRPRASPESRSQLHLGGLPRRRHVAAGQRTRSLLGDRRPRGRNGRRRGLHVPGALRRPHGRYRQPHSTQQR